MKWTLDAVFLLCKLLRTSVISVTSWCARKMWLFRFDMRWVIWISLPHVFCIARFCYFSLRVPRSRTQKFQNASIISSHLYFLLFPNPSVRPYSSLTLTNTTLLKHYKQNKTAIHWVAELIPIIFRTDLLFHTHACHIKVELNNTCYYTYMLARHVHTIPGHANVKDVQLMCVCVCV